MATYLPTVRRLGPSLSSYALLLVSGKIKKSVDIVLPVCYYMGMTLQERKQQLNKAVDKSETALLAFTNKHRGAMGLTSDAAVATDTYKTLKAQFNKDFANLRAFNATYAKELRASRG